MLIQWKTFFSVSFSLRCRYYAICHPLRARHVHTTARALALVAVIWVASLLLLGPQLLIQRLEPVLVLQPRLQPPIRVAQVWTCSLRLLHVHEN